MDINPINVPEENTNQAVAPVNPPQQTTQAEPVMPQPGTQQTFQPATTSNKTSKKLLFWCLIFPWVLIFGNMVLGTLLNLLFYSMDAPEVVRRLVSLITLLIGLIGLLCIPAGLVYYIVKASKNN